MDSCVPSAIKAYPASISTGPVRVGAGGDVLVGTLVARAILLIVLHLSNVGAAVPPGRLNLVPDRHQEGQHHNTNQGPQQPWSRGHDDEQAKGDIQAKQPAPGELYKTQLGQNAIEHKAKRQHENCSGHRPASQRPPNLAVASSPPP